MQPIKSLAGVVLLAAASCCAHAAAPAGFCSAAALQSLQNERLHVKTVSWLDGRDNPPGDVPPLGTGTDTTLTGFCRIEASAFPTDDSLINFEVWIPARADWNGKLVSTGNGGTNPALQYNDMMFALRRGYATVGGDTGHQSQNIQWGRGHPEKIKDWGIRSIHVITVAAKAMVATLLDRQPARSFYYGCSTGGHQGLTEVQLYPGDFDGVIAGDPANNWIRWSASSLWMYVANHAPGDNKPLVTRDWQGLIRDHVMQQCDALDGRADGIIEDPRQCTWQRMDFAALQCKDGQGGTQCLTTTQIGALHKMYQGLRHPVTGEQEYPGLMPGTEEAWGGVLGNAPPRGDFWRYWVYDTDNFDIWHFDFADALRTADNRIGAMVDATNADLSAFRKRGGKLIVYHGWADPSVNPLDSVKYYEKVKSTMGSQAIMDEFYQLFLVPGMGHCGGGLGATVFGNASLQAPHPTADNDMLMALERWLDTGKAPASLHSVEIRDDQVISTRLLCPWPRQGGPDAKSCHQQPDADDRKVATRPGSGTHANAE
ncbi:MAG TPA: tannase/feruloyl esterase family alpha/beta hydrolase [Candidatus Acidoferrum sp.]|nr:tannase/feruloyl esterase family alpha/beta hydrolase [Candidatus Acidoferrum sp.]